jgi:hypothetical protein
LNRADFGDPADAYVSTDTQLASASDDKREHGPTVLLLDVSSFGATDGDVGVGRLS